MAILLTEEIPNARLSELEENSIDNIVLTIVSNSLILVESTASVQPKNTDSQDTMNVLKTIR